jgi:hypothetical protein
MAVWPGLRILLSHADACLTFQRADLTLHRAHSLVQLCNAAVNWRNLFPPNAHDRFLTDDG